MFTEQAVVLLSSSTSILRFAFQVEAGSTVRASCILKQPGGAVACQTRKCTARFSVCGRLFPINLFPHYRWCVRSVRLCLNSRRKQVARCFARRSACLTPRHANCVKKIVRHTRQRYDLLSQLCQRQTTPLRVTFF